MRWDQTRRPGRPARGGEAAADRARAGGAGPRAAFGWLGATLAIAAAAPAFAQQPPTGVEPAEPYPGAYERLAFDAADTDGDGVVSEGELARDAAAGFSSLDRDRGGTLAPGELGPHDPAQFKRVDANGDGALTFAEVMRNKVKALERGDKDKDGGLSFQEMVDEVRMEEGGAR